MLELNRSERRALLLGTALIVLGAGARIGFGPGPVAFRWEEADDAARDPAAGPDAAAGPRTAAERLGVAPGRPLDAVRAAVAENLARERRASRPLADGERIDPNRAPAEELRRLPGIGSATASAILEDRDRAGPFRRAEDLERVSGIGPVTVRRIRPHLNLAAAAGAGVPDPPGSAERAAAGGAGRSAPDPAAPRARREHARVDVNRAGPEELERLPGIGPSLAARIVADRARQGSFREPEDLLRVPGIGPRRLEALRDGVVFR